MMAQMHISYHKHNQLKHEAAVIKLNCEITFIMKMFAVLCASEACLLHHSTVLVPQLSF